MSALVTSCDQLLVVTPSVASCLVVTPSCLVVTPSVASCLVVTPNSVHLWEVDLSSWQGTLSANPWHCTTLDKATC